MLFVPAGALLVLAAARWRIGWVLVPLGLVRPGGVLVGIELTQLELARIDRACDVTDVVDNVIGAADRRRRSGVRAAPWCSGRGEDARAPTTGRTKR